MSEPLNDAALDRIFRTARTANGYLDKPVSTQQLHQLWDLMKMGPTSANMLPARLVWCVSDEAKAKLAACAIPKMVRKSAPLRSAWCSAWISISTRSCPNCSPTI